MGDIFNFNFNFNFNLFLVLFLFMLNVYIQPYAYTGFSKYRYFLVPTPTTRVTISSGISYQKQAAVKWYETRRWDNYHKTRYVIGSSAAIERLIAQLAYVPI